MTEHKSSDIQDAKLAALAAELALYDDLLIAVCALQADQSIVYFNAQFLTFTKQPPRKLRHKTIAEVLHSPIFAQGDLVQRAWHENSPVVSEETTIDVSSGSGDEHELRDAIFKFIPHTSSTGEKYLILSIHDVSIERILHAKHRVQLDELKAKNEEIKRYSEGLERLVEERTHELSVAMHQSEKLLLNILPQKVAERLKAAVGTIADRFPQVSVLFADIVGFTTVSGTMDPVHVVEFLSRIFNEFDRLTDKHGVEKIKTIGDAYLAVAGVPSEHPQHAAAVCRLALDMRDTMLAINQELKTGLHCRWGIASGPVVAGVLGTRKFAYDIWGDTVNVASRMESNGSEDKIQIAESTYELIKDQFVCQERGSINVKGKGIMRAYWLLGSK